VGLTQSSKASSLARPVFARSIFSVMLTAALIGYAFDCAPMATAQQAMQCCKSMQCMRHGHHGQDCCKEMPSTRDVVGQPTSASHSFAAIAVGLVQPLDESLSVASSTRRIEDQSHAPPILSPPNILPLRI
jgi:hypothetical protein